MTGSMPTTQATGDVILKSSTLTNLSVTTPGSGYQFTPTLDISGSGTSASGTLTLKEKGSFAGIEITYDKDCTFMNKLSNSEEVISYFDEFNDNKASERIINYIENE